MARLRVRWQVTEEHSAEIVVPDYDYDEGVDDTLLADNEGNESYEFTPDRTLLEAEVLSE